MWKSLQMDIKSSNFKWYFFLKLLGLPPLYHLYVQINSLKWLASQESFAIQVLKILITSHICIRSWERTHGWMDNVKTKFAGGINRYV